MHLISKINHWVVRHKTGLSAWSSAIAIISLPLIFISLLIAYYQLHDILVLPDVELEFVHSASVDYKLVNKSSKVAEDIIVSFGIYDLDSSLQGPVPILSVGYEYVNRESAKGPFEFADKFSKIGHRYFGIVYVGCKGCENLNTYWFFTKHGESIGSFYAKRNRNDTFAINYSQLISKTKPYLDSLVPENRRIYIK
jgi:hypothetical protein